MQCLKDHYFCTSNNFCTINIVLLSTVATGTDAFHSIPCRSLTHHTTNNTSLIISILGVCNSGWQCYLCHSILWQKYSTKQITWGQLKQRRFHSCTGAKTFKLQIFKISNNSKFGYNIKPAPRSTVLKALFAIIQVNRNLKSPWSIITHSRNPNSSVIILIITNFFWQV